MNTRYRNRGEPGWGFSPTDPTKGQTVWDQPCIEGDMDMKLSTRSQVWHQPGSLGRG